MKGVLQMSKNINDIQSVTNEDKMQEEGIKNINQHNVPNTKKIENIIKNNMYLVCKKSNKIMFDPVFNTLDCKTYEREALLSSSNGKIASKILTNQDKKTEITKFVNIHPEIKFDLIYGNQYYYFPKENKIEFEKAILNASLAAVVKMAKEDPRLLAVTINDKNKQNCLHIAMQSKQPYKMLETICKMQQQEYVKLKDHQDEVLDKVLNAQDQAGNTPLLMAVQKKEYRCTSYLLLNKSADANIQNKKGELAIALIKQLAVNANDTQTNIRFSKIFDTYLNQQKINELQYKTTDDGQNILPREFYLAFKGLQDDYLKLMQQNFTHIKFAQDCLEKTNKLSKTVESLSAELNDIKNQSLNNTNTILNNCNVIQNIKKDIACNNENVTALKIKSQSAISFFNAFEPINVKNNQYHYTLAPYDSNDNYGDCSSSNNNYIRKDNKNSANSHKMKTLIGFAHKLPDIYAVKVNKLPRGLKSEIRQWQNDMQMNISSHLLIQYESEEHPNDIQKNMLFDAYRNNNSSFMAEYFHEKLNDSPVFSNYVFSSWHTNIFKDAKLNQPFKLEKFSEEAAIAQHLLKLEPSTTVLNKFPLT